MKKNTRESFRKPRRPSRESVARAMELLPEVESAVDALFWDRADRPKRLAALRTLMAAAACEPGVEAIRAHGGVDRLRKALAWDDEASVDAAAKVLAACSGSTARGPGVRTFTFSGTGAHAHVTHDIRLRETDYVEGGLGWRVWASGVVMCRELIRRTCEGSLVVRDADVLELGAGCGVAGFLCAKLGAARVTFTDYLPGLLANLDASVALQAEDARGGPPCAFRVRHLEWLSSDPALSAEWSSRRPMGGDGSCAANASANDEMVRTRALPSDERFGLIVGSDVCYEDPLPRALAATVDARLKKNGLCWFVLPVRAWPNETGAATIARLVAAFELRNLRVEVEKAPDLADDEYEGGTFVRHDGGMVSVFVTRSGDA